MHRVAHTLRATVAVARRTGAPDRRRPFVVVVVASSVVPRPSVSSVSSGASRASRPVVFGASATPRGVVVMASSGASSNDVTVTFSHN
jgi:hypothetical protein